MRTAIKGLWESPVFTEAKVSEKADTPNINTRVLIMNRNK